MAFIGVPGAKSIAIAATVWPSPPARTVVTSFASSESPAGSVMIVLREMSAGPGVVSLMTVLGNAAGIGWRPQITLRLTTMVGAGSTGVVAPRLRSFASQTSGAVPVFDSVRSTLVVSP